MKSVILVGIVTIANAVFGGGGCGPLPQCGVCVNGKVVNVCEVNNGGCTEGCCECTGRMSFYVLNWSNRKKQKANMIIIISIDVYT